MVKLIHWITSYEMYTNMKIKNKQVNRILVNRVRLVACFAVMKHVVDGQLFQSWIVIAHISLHGTAYLAISLFSTLSYTVYKHCPIRKPCLLLLFYEEGSCAYLPHVNKMYHKAKNILNATFTTFIVFVSFLFNMQNANQWIWKEDITHMQWIIVVVILSDIKRIDTYRHSM